MRRKKKMVPTIVLLTLFTSFTTNTKAQVPITLSAAIDTALKNNLSLRSQQLQADYLQKLKGTAYVIPHTSVNVEYGQINSAYSDNRLQLAQSIKFPTVYKRQQELFEQEWKAGLLNVAIQQTEIKKQVAATYFEMVYLQQKQKLLH